MTIIETNSRRAAVPLARVLLGTLLLASTLSVTSGQAGGMEPADRRGERAAEDPEVVDGRPAVFAGNPNAPTRPLPRQTPAAMAPIELTSVPSLQTPLFPAAAEVIDLVSDDAFLVAVTPAPGIASSDLQIATDDGLGDLATNMTGCALPCVSTATLTTNLTTPSLDLDVETTVPARIDISLTNTENGDESLFTSSGYGTAWSTTLSPLEAGTEYDLVLEAFDQDGQRQIHTHTLTTTTPIGSPGQLQDNEPGCAGSCIVHATVTPTDRPDEVRFDVVTNTPASVKIWMSTDAPGWIAGTPFLPAEALVEPTLGIKTEFSVEKAYLDPDMTYHVIVRAEDDNGVDYQIGDFTTGPPPPVDVRVTFEQIFVQWDGDPGPLNRGELSFAWGFDDGELLPYSQDIVGRRSEEKMDGGTIIDIPSYNGVAWLSLGEGDSIPAPGAAANERDLPVICGPSCQYPAGLAMWPIHLGGPGRINPAWGEALTLEEIKTQQTCGELGFENALPDDFCVTFESYDHYDEQFPNIQVIVSYHIDD